MRLRSVIVSLALASSALCANRQGGVNPHFHQGIPLIRVSQYAGAAPTPAPFGINPTVTLPSNYKLVWNQDFRTPQYANINTSGILSTGTISPPAIWSTTSVGTPTSYTPPGTDHFPFSTDAGYLVISQFNKPDGTASGGIMHSSHKGTGFVAANAYWEASIRLPGGGKNQWPAFWMVSSPWTSNSAEIDIAENGYQIPNSTNGVAPIHLHNWTSTDHGGSQGDFQISSLRNTPGGWHAFGCLIQPGSVTIYLDGAKVTSFSVGPNFSNSMGVVLQMTNYTGTTTGTPGDLGVQYVRCWAP
jgi:hypothetical protein